MASLAVMNDLEGSFAQDESKQDGNPTQADKLLTPTIEKSTKETPSSQTAAFLQILPLELRLQIYRHVLHSWIYGTTLHIFQTRSIHHPGSSHYRRLTYASCLSELGDPYWGGLQHSHWAEWPKGHVSCGMYSRREPPSLDVLRGPGREEATPPWPKQEIVDHWRWNQRRPEGGELRAKDTFMALPLTCRQVYQESINLLYSDFHFDLLSLPIAHRFLTRTPPHHLSKIKSLSLAWIVNNVHHRQDECLAPMETDWPEIFSIIKNMSSLQNLRVSIYHIPYRLEVEICRPLRDIEIPNGEFVVDLPFDRRNRREKEISHVAENELYKFRIERRQMEEWGWDMDVNQVITAATHGGRRKGNLRILWECCCLPCVCVWCVGSLVFEDLGKRWRKAKIGIFQRVRGLALNGAEDQEGSSVRTGSNV